MQIHLEVARSLYLFSPNLAKIVATCYLLCLQHRRTLKVGLVAIEKGNNVTNLLFFEHVIFELILASK